jgi:hypothetical protein
MTERMEATITIMRLNVSEDRVINRAILFFSAISAAISITLLSSPVCSLLHLYCPRPRRPG